MMRAQYSRDLNNNYSIVSVGTYLGPYTIQPCYRSLFDLFKEPLKGTPQNSLGNYLGPYRKPETEVKDRRPGASLNLSWSVS